MNVVLVVVTSMLLVMTYLLKNKKIINQSYHKLIQSTFRLKRLLLIMMFTIMGHLVLVLMGYGHWLTQMILLICYGYIVFAKGEKLLWYGIAHQWVMGHYLASKSVSKDSFDLIAQMNNGHRSDKIINELTKSFFSSNVNPMAIENLFGPKALLHHKSFIYKRVFKRDYAGKPFDYALDSGYVAIPNEFFLLVDLLPNHIEKILSLYNGLYAIKDGDFQISQLIRVLGQLDKNNKFGDEYIEVITPFLIQGLKTKSTTSNRCYRRIKELYLIKMYFRYMLKSGATQVADRLFKEGQFIGETDPTEHLDILLFEGNKLGTSESSQFVDNVFMLYESHGVTHQKIMSKIQRIKVL